HHEKAVAQGVIIEVDGRYGRDAGLDAEMLHVQHQGEGPEQVQEDGAHHQAPQGGLRGPFLGGEPDRVMSDEHDCLPIPAYFFVKAITSAVTPTTKAPPATHLEPKRSSKGLWPFCSPDLSSLAISCFNTLTSWELSRRSLC